MNFQVKDGNVKWIKLPDGRVVPQRSEASGENEFPGKVLGTDPARTKMATSAVPTVGNGTPPHTKRKAVPTGYSFRVLQSQSSELLWVRNPDGTVRIERKKE